MIEDMERTDREHLSQISTQWTMLLRAHATPADRALAAQHALLERYGGAVGRYLLGAVRDPDLAQELAQEFAVAFLDGAVRGADPGKGRFRDYLKGVLRNLIREHRRPARRPPAAAGDEPPERG